MHQHCKVCPHPSATRNMNRDPPQLRRFLADDAKYYDFNRIRYYGDMVDMRYKWNEFRVAKGYS